MEASDAEILVANEGGPQGASAGESWRKHGAPSKSLSFMRLPLHTMMASSRWSRWSRYMEEVSRRCSSRSGVYNGSGSSGLLLGLGYEYTGYGLGC